MARLFYVEAFKVASFYCVLKKPAVLEDTAGFVVLL
jgi:hypothetical protein